MSWLRSAAGYSAAFAESVGTFDFTFLTDLLRNHGDALPVLISLGGIVIVAYLLLRVFCTGGILHCFIYRDLPFTWNHFLGGCSRYFGRMLLLTVCVLMIHLALLACVVLIFVLSGLHPLEMESEMELIRLIWIVMPLYLILVCLVAMLHGYLKIELVQSASSGVITVFRKGIAFVRHNFWTAATVYLLNLVFLAACFLIYHFLKGLIPNATTGGMIIAFILGQVYLVARIGVWMMILASACAVKAGAIAGHAEATP